MKVETEYGDVLKALKNAEAAGEPAGLEGRATAPARDDAPPAPPWGAFEEHADELYRYLSALVDGDSWLAEHVLGEAFVRVGGKREPTLPELIQAGRHAALESLAKSGPAASEQGPLSHGDRALVLERRLGLSMDALTRTWSQMPSRLIERLETCVAHLVHHLEQQEGAPAPACAEWRHRLGHALLDLLEGKDAEAYAEHRTECPACAQWIELLEETMTPPAKSLPAPDKTRQRLEERLATSSHVLPIDMGIQVSVTCCFCHDGMQRKEAAFCATCLAPHHPDCFQEHGRCATPGCEGVDVVYPQAIAPQRPGRRGWIGPAIAVVGVLLGAAAFAGLKAKLAAERAKAAAFADQQAEQTRALQEELEAKLAKQQAGAQATADAPPSSGAQTAAADGAMSSREAQAALDAARRAEAEAEARAEIARLRKEAARAKAEAMAQERMRRERERDALAARRGGPAPAPAGGGGAERPEATPPHRPLNLSETETTELPAGTYTVPQFMAVWAKANGRALTVDPGYASGKIAKVMDYEPVIKLDAPRKLSRVQLRALLDTCEAVLVVGKENTAAVHWQRNVASKVGNDALLIEGDTPVDPDAFVSRMISVRNGAGSAIFATVRGVLTRDPNRIGNILYNQGSEQITIIDLARKVRLYEEMIVKLDVPAQRRPVRVEVFRVGVNLWTEMRKGSTQDALTKMRAFPIEAHLESMDLNLEDLRLPRDGNLSLSKRSFELLVGEDTAEQKELEVRAERRPQGGITLTMATGGRQLQCSLPLGTERTNLSSTLLSDGTCLVFAVSEE